ncbi:MAG: hypothetical protein B6I24_09870 [Bacteroidetes bacterium 4572_128]|nr:MAG: hypothetical protein B6I24_09870 [Bacteroidetes bacterium 4572_128]
MKKQDLIFLAVIVIFFLPFFISEEILNFYKNFNKEHGILMSFVKFSILATLGEVIGLRIKEKVYFKKGFGIVPRAIVWGFLGITIKMAFIIFAKGVPEFLIQIGLENINDENFLNKLIKAFSISASMNLIYAPIMMTLHKITDTHILYNNGKIMCIFKKIKFGEILINLNWSVQWNFVFKKTIPFFWIPAHTITFLLPAEYQILFAAILGIILGILLAIASLKK